MADSFDGFHGKREGEEKAKEPVTLKFYTYLKKDPAPEKTDDSLSPEERKLIDGSLSPEKNDDSLSPEERRLIDGSLSPEKNDDSLSPKEEIEKLKNELL